MTVHGSARVELELEGEVFLSDIVVVSSLTTEAILGLDFLKEREASIDLASKRLRLKGKGCDLPLRDPTPPRARTGQPIRAARTIESPPRSVMEVEASIEVPVEGMWLVQEATDKCLPAAVACALVEPASTAIPLRLLNSRTEPVTVYAGMTLATLEDAEVLAGAVDAVSGRNETATVDAAKQEIYIYCGVSWSGRDQTSARVRKTCFFISYCLMQTSSRAPRPTLGRRTGCGTTSTLEKRPRFVSLFVVYTAPASRGGS